THHRDRQPDPLQRYARSAERHRAGGGPAHGGGAAGDGLHLGGDRRPARAGRVVTTERSIPMDLDELIGDLEAEEEALGRVLARMPATAWNLPTHAPGWAVRDQVSHLASTDEDAMLAIVDPAEFTARTERRRTAGEEPRGTFLERGRSLSPDELLA